MPTDELDIHVPEVLKRTVRELDDALVVEVVVRCHPHTCTRRQFEMFHATSMRRRNGQ